MKMASGEFLRDLSRIECSGSGKESKLLIPPDLDELVILKRGSTISELLRISPRNLTFERYLNPMVQFIYEHLRSDVKIKTDREWYERRLEYRWNVQHAVA